MQCFKHVMQYLATCLLPICDSRPMHYAACHLHERISFLAAGHLSKRKFSFVTAVQELIEGKSLAQMVEAGWQPAQKEVERIAHELLTTFSYLQQQQVWTTACVQISAGAGQSDWWIRHCNSFMSAMSDGAIYHQHCVSRL